MQIICTSLQTDNHASTLPLSFYRPDALPVAQPTASKHWRLKSSNSSAQNIIIGGLAEQYAVIYVYMCVFDFISEIQVVINVNIIFMCSIFQLALLNIQR